MEITKTCVHLKNANGWTKSIEHVGDYNCDGVYMERRKPDLSKPLGELIPDDMKYHLYREYITKSDGEYIKIMFFQE